MDDKFAFSFDAAVDKVQTLADGGIKVSLLLAESAIPQAALFMECKRNHIALKVTCKTGSKQHGQMGKGDKRKSTWASTETESVDEDTGSRWEQEGDAAGWESGSEEEDTG